MSDYAGRKDINGNDIHEGDYVHCWDGKPDQSEVSQSLRGMVSKVEYSDEVQFEVAGNNLALSCAEYVEILDLSNKE